jgi:hypothetical protein
VPIPPAGGNDISGRVGRGSLSPSVVHKPARTEPQPRRSHRVGQDQLRQRAPQGHRRGHERPRTHCRGRARASMCCRGQGPGARSTYYPPLGRAQRVPRAGWRDGGARRPWGTHCRGVISCLTRALVVAGFARTCYVLIMRAPVCVVLLALDLAGCGGETAETGARDHPCDAPTLTNCPQGIVTGVGECPLPPVIQAQGFYTVGCKITAECSIGTQVCVCQMGPKGAQWACSL